MSTQIDWRGELDSSFGDGPDRPPADYLGPARAALRRRRTAMGAAALASAIMIGGIGWAIAPGDGDSRSGEVATDPSDTSSPSPSPTETPEDSIADEPGDVRTPAPGEAKDFLTHSTDPVTANGTGDLIRKPGWDVEAIYVLENKPKSRVWGVSAVPTAGGEAIWMILDWAPGSSSSLSDPAGKRFAVFEDWLDTTWAEQQAMEQHGRLQGLRTRTPVLYMANGELVVPPDDTLLETVEDPEEAAAYGPVAEFVAAKVRRTDGKIYFAIVGTNTYTVLDSAVLDAPTMSAFLAHLQAQGDSGEGLR